MARTTPVACALAALAASVALAQEPYYLVSPGAAALAALLAPGETLADVGRSVAIGGLAPAQVHGAPVAAAAHRPTGAARRRAAAARAALSCALSDDLSVNLAVFFAVNSADLAPAHEPFIVDLAELLHRNPAIHLTVSGHTDVSGGDAINAPLSQRRAQAVVDRLVSRYGVERARLQPVGRASRQLCFPGAPRSALNRRISVSRL